MFTITFRGHFETENQDKFIEKLQEILKETDTTYFGQVDSFKEPEYVDFQKVEVKDAGESDNQSEGTENKTI